MKRGIWLLVLGLLSPYGAGAESPAAGGLSRVIVEHGLSALGCDSQGRAGESLLLEGLNTPIVPDLLQIRPDAHWRWSETVISSLQANTPRVHLDLNGPKGEHYYWTLAFRKKSLVDRVVLTNTCRRGSEILPADYKVEHQWADFASFDPVFLTQVPLHQQKARRDIKPDIPLRVQDLEDKPDEEVGASVMVVSSSEGVTMSLPAVSLEAGFHGKAFRVKLLSTNRIASAWVWSNGDVHDCPQPTK